jgi:3-phosphoshikimate 1-carboxyvinyltransferase
LSKSSTHIINRLSVIGLGLIGGSLALAARQKGLAKEVVAFDQNPGELEVGLAKGLIDKACTSLKEAVEGADVLVIAVPVRSVLAVLQSVAPFLDASTILTDVGSVKGSFVQAAEQVFGKSRHRIVPGHPIAGSEESGAGAANGELFTGYKVILTPLEYSDAEATKTIAQLWAGCGATVLSMGVAHHDDVLAATSHLPHLIAFSLVDTLAGEEDNREIFQYAAGGFRDFTRIAASDPVMWRDIFLVNRDATLAVLDRFMDDLGRLREAIHQQDAETMMNVFSRAKSARLHFNKILADQAYSQMKNSKEVTFYLQPGSQVQGILRVPGDKSMSHRSIMLGALAEGTTKIEGFLEGEDSLATLQAFRDMGVSIEGPIEGRVTIEGVGLHGLKAPAKPLYMGNSGTAMRLFSGLLAGQSFDSELTGDESLSQRPMERVASPLRMMGASIETAENGRPPLRIKGGQSLKGIQYDMPMASAQVKSCVLLAGLYAQGETSVTEPAPTRDHTERMLTGFGYPVDKDGATATLSSGHRLSATHINVPADISSATFFMVAAAIAPGSDVTLTHVGVNPTRIGVINILKLMGADISLLNEKEVGGEPVADIRVRYRPLQGINIPEDQVPLAIDEFPALFIAAASAQGTTRLTGAEELRVKESDRIQVMADGLQALGVASEVLPDGIIIEGPQKLSGGVIDSHGDHRIAMSFAVASLIADGNIQIENCANVATSFPGFVELAQQAGIHISQG